MFEYIPAKLIVHIGSWKKEMDAYYSEDLPADTVGLSKYASSTFMLPDSLPYEVMWKGRNIYIGPVIAYLIEAQEKYITPERLEKLKVYYINYSEIKGAVFICAVDQINLTDKTIGGYYYDGRSWTAGTFPYPGSIYRKADIPQDIFDDLINNMGDKIFNSYFFDKWETWQLLSPYPDLKSHLPHTEKLDGIDSLDGMLDHYGSAYLKQTRGYKAKGIIKATRSEDGYHFQYRLEGETVIGSREKADQFLRNLNEQKKGNNYYLLQQEVCVKRYRNRPFDFRVVLQKDESMRWKCSGIIARFGKKESIATNFLLSGYALTGYEALKRVFHLSERDAFLKQQEIIEICMNACKTLEKCIGHYADIGVDVMLDGDQNVWILEINKTHDHRFPLYSINDTQMYTTIISRPFKYAKALAGF